MRKDPFLEQIKQDESGFKIETTTSLIGHRKINYNKPFRLFKTSFFFKSVHFIWILGLPLFAIYMQINKPTPMTENQQTGMLVAIIVFFMLLVNAMKNMQAYWIYNLINFHSTNFFGFQMTLAKYIEHFKPAKAN